MPKNVVSENFYMYVKVKIEILEVVWKFLHLNLSELVTLNEND